MKSKKLLLIASSFFVIGTLASCGRNENEGLSAEFKEEKRYNIGDTISKDDIRVTYTKGNSVKELESKDFNVEGFDKEGKYTFEYDSKIEPTNRTKTFNVTYNKLKTTASTELFNGRVTADEFNHAIDYLRNVSPTRNYTCEVSFVESSSFKKEPEVEEHNNVYVYGGLIKAIVERTHPESQKKKEVNFEDYNFEFGKYFLYDEAGDFDLMGSGSRLEERYLDFNYFDYLKLLFDEKECFDENNKNYEFGFDIGEEQGGTKVKMSVKVNVGFDSNLNITYLNDVTREEVEEGGESGWVELKIDRTFSNYGVTEEVKLPKGAKPIYNAVGEGQDGYKHKAVTKDEDCNTLFAVRLTKELSDNPDDHHQVYLVKENGEDYSRADLENINYDVFVDCLFPGGEITLNLVEGEGNYFEIPAKDLAGKKILLFDVLFRDKDGKRINTGIRFVPAFKD